MGNGLRLTTPKVVLLSTPSPCPPPCPFFYPLRPTSPVPYAFFFSKFSAPLLYPKPEHAVAAQGEPAAQEEGAGHNALGDALLRGRGCGCAVSGVGDPDGAQLQNVRQD